MQGSPAWDRPFGNVQVNPALLLSENLIYIVFCIYPAETI